MKDFNLAQEKKMQKEITAALPDIKAAYKSSEEEGEAFVTDLAMRMAEEQYAGAQDMYSRLLFTQMDNINDRPDNEGKTVFSMPGFEERPADVPDTAAEDGEKSAPAPAGMTAVIALLCLLIALVAADIIIRRKKGKSEQ